MQVTSYSKIYPQFWTGRTGKLLREAGSDAQHTALYLITNPHSNWTGIYSMPIPIMAFETARGFEGASEALRRTIEAGFCQYDYQAEVVWIPEMARFQVGDALSAKDNRVKGISNDLKAMRNMPFVKCFYEKYAVAYCIEYDPQDKGLISPSEGATKPPALSPSPSPALSPAPISPIPPEGGSERKHRSKKSYNGEFEIFWNTTRFPKRQQDTKGEMFKKYCKAIKDGCTPEEIATAADAFADGNASVEFPIGMRKFLEPMTIREWLSKPESPKQKQDEEIKRIMEKAKAQAAREREQDRLMREQEEKAPPKFEEYDERA